MNLAWATPEDADTLAAAHALAFPEGWNPDIFIELFASPGVFGLLARDGGGHAPLGLLLCRVAAGEMEVLTLGVSPPARRRGVAKALMSAALEAAREAGADVAFLEVAADNASAAALYAGLGFRRAGLRRGYYRRPDGQAADALVMRLDLGAKFS